MRVDKIAQVPPPMVQADTTVKVAIPHMKIGCGCGVAVMDGDQFVGTVSLNNILMRVAAGGLDVDTTTVRDVMHPPVDTVTADTDAKAAVKKMHASGLCYLGVVDTAGALTGWLNLCDLFKVREDGLEHEMDSIISYLAADGPGG